MNILSSYYIYYYREPLIKQLKRPLKKARGIINTTGFLF